MKPTGSNSDGTVGCPIASQADYVLLLGLDNGDIVDWNYLDADEDADISLF